MNKEKKMLNLYDSLSGEKREFIPITPNEISIYCCGITVYDYCHIGHARSIIVFDVIVRYLRSQGWKVNYVRNITDVDDKIIKRANENKESCENLTERFITAMHEDEKALDILPPDHEPRATEYMPRIIALIDSIIERSYGYVADSGDVCFDVRRFEKYGALSRRNIEDLIAGARVEIGAGKRDPLDFVLWKKAKSDEPHWDSPWGIGRPGWHIECSAMSTALLGIPFDIHGGGMDLKFPHHENEIAQSCAASNDGFANYWMHVGLLNVNGEKMSKSLGNFFTIREVLEKYDAELIRYFMISGHYRSPVNYAEENLSQLQSGLDRLYLALRDLPGAADEKNDFEEKFHAAMQDDFNTPLAMSVLFDMAHEIQRLREQGEIMVAAKLGKSMVKLAGVFGFLQKDPNTYFHAEISSDEIEKIEALIAERQQARADKNWQRADEIRDVLKAMNIVIEDASGKTTWRRI